jgi:protein-disulfide isomerase
MLHQRPFELNTLVNAADHVRGNDSAAVTLVEYGDFECPYCKQAAPAVKLLLARFEGRIRFVYRHFPLEEFHPHARRAAEASECAGAQRKFWEMHDVLFSNQLRLQEHYLRDYARDLRLDVDRFVVDMRDSVYLPRVHEHQRSGSESGVRSTPGFFINGRIHDASFSLHSLTDAVEAALAGARQS